MGEAQEQTGEQAFFSLHVYSWKGGAWEALFVMTMALSSVLHFFIYQKANEIPAETGEHVYGSILYAKGVERLWKALTIELLFSLKGSRIYISQISDRSAPRLSEQNKPELFIGWNLNSKFVLIAKVRTRLLQFNGGRFCATSIVYLFTTILQYSMSRSQ